MPGPSNRRKKVKHKNDPASSRRKEQPLSTLSSDPSNIPESSSPQRSPLSDDSNDHCSGTAGNATLSDACVVIHTTPTSDGHGDTTATENANISFIENKWSGPRVTDVSAFVSSSYAAPPSISDPLCAEFSQPETRNLLFLLLPPENALIMWYNKSRKSARICPVCRRFYSIGDLLMPHLIDDQSRSAYVDPRNLREKEISGICSLMCFGIASYNWPGSIGAWGKWSSEIGPQTRVILQGSGAGIADEGMGAFMKLARNEHLLPLARRGL